MDLLIKPIATGWVDTFEMGAGGGRRARVVGAGTWKHMEIKCLHYMDMTSTLSGHIGIVCTGLP